MASMMQTHKISLHSQHVATALSRTCALTTSWPTTKRSAQRLNSVRDVEEPYLIDYRHSDVSGRLRIAQMPERIEDDSIHYKELSGATVLLIGSEDDCVHSVYRHDRVLTDGFWDLYGLLPPLIPRDGIIGIYGLGAGTVARLIHHYYPEQKMIGWEIDSEIVDLGRRHMELDLLEKSGCLEVRIEDCFAKTATVAEGFAGLIVDVFVDNKLHTALSKVAAANFVRLFTKRVQVETWTMLKSRLADGGRIMANIEGDELSAMFTALNGDGRFLQLLSGRAFQQSCSSSDDETGDRMYDTTI